VNPADEL
jgi:hypothetical protein